MNGYLKIKTSIDNTGVNKQIEQLESKLNDLKATLAIAGENEGILSESEIIETEAQVEKLTNQLSKLKQKQSELDSENWNNINKNIEKANKGITSTIKKVGRWALAIFAVESAYGFISSTMTRVSDLNEQLGANIEYIRNSLASALMPLIEFIVNLAVKLLGLINAISISLFGVDLFSRNMADSIDDANSSAKSLKKSLAGFDEMNILNDSSVGATPTLNMQDATNQMVKWFEDVKSKWTNLGNEMAQYLANPSLFTDTFGAWGVAVMGFTYIFYGLWEVVTGVFEGIAGLVQMLVGVFTGNQELITEGWNNFCQGLWKIIKGVWDTIVGIILSVVGIIIGLFSELLSGVVGIFLEMGNWINNMFIKPMVNSFQNLYKSIINIFSGIVSFFSSIFNKTVAIFKNIGSAIGNAVSFAFKTAINGALSLVENILNTPIKAINGLLSIINAVPGVNIPKLTELRLPRLKSGGIVNNPGKGVVMNGYVAGEAGREGVIPLTNPYAMQTLGREIGKWIKVNNTSNTYLDGRLIQKNQDKVREELAFATNGGKS